MSNPNYPEGVSERDIDRIGEPMMAESESYDIANQMRDISFYTPFATLQNQSQKEAYEKDADARADAELMDAMFEEEMINFENNQRDSK